MAERLSPLGVAILTAMEESLGRMPAPADTLRQAFAEKRLELAIVLTKVEVMMGRELCDVIHLRKIVSKQIAFLLWAAERNTYERRKKYIIPNEVDEERVEELEAGICAADIEQNQLLDPQKVEAFEILRRRGLFNVFIQLFRTLKERSQKKLRNRRT